MQSLILHEFYDENIKKVLMDNPDIIIIVLEKSNKGYLMINREDVIALAKDFRLTRKEITESEK